MKETVVKCSNCGAEIVIPNHEHPVSGIAVGKDSNLGTIYLPTEESNKAIKVATNKNEMRLQAMKSAGLDTDGYIALSGANGESFMFRQTDGGLQMVNDSELDSIDAYIIAKGTIPNKNLFRRWVLAQMFHMMTQTRWRSNTPIGFTEAIRWKGYEYMWKMIRNEIFVQTKIVTKDHKEFLNRNAWFNKELIVEMMEDYLRQLKKYVGYLRVRFCKGVPYKRIQSRDIFVEDLDSKLYNPIENAIRRMKSTKDISATYSALLNFETIRVRTPYFKQSKQWVDAYKGCGSYYGMQNLILWSGCRIHDEYGAVLDKYESMDYLNKKKNEYKGEGWRMFAVFKKLLADNNVDPATKIAEWRKAKRNK